MTVFFLLIFFVVVFVFSERISLCFPGCPGTHSVAQAGLELTGICLPLEPKTCATTAQLNFYTIKYQSFYFTEITTTSSSLHPHPVLVILQWTEKL